MGAQARKALLDKYWLALLLGCVGERFSEDDEICGIIVNVKHAQDKYARLLQCPLVAFECVCVCECVCV